MHKKKIDKKLTLGDWIRRHLKAKRTQERQKNETLTKQTQRD